MGMTIAVAGSAMIGASDPARKEGANGGTRGSPVFGSPVT
jgi:hypothetical protein